MKNTRKLTISAIMIALYVVIMYFTQSFAFGPYQIRIATSIYALGFIYPFLIIPLGIANFISNIVMGGLGVFDMLGGALVGIITTGLCVLIRKKNLNLWFILLPITFGPGLIVPTWLSYLIGVPYNVLAVSLCIGQVIPAIVGVLLVKNLKGKIKE